LILLKPNRWPDVVGRRQGRGLLKDETEVLAKWQESRERKDRRNHEDKTDNIICNPADIQTRNVERLKRKYLRDIRTSAPASCQPMLRRSRSASQEACEALPALWT